MLFQPLKYLPPGMPSRAHALITACAISALAPNAEALGFGKVGASAVLGQPLDLPVPLHLDPGEQLDPQCLQAEVLVGDNHWGRDQVRARLEPGPGGTQWVARVVSVPVVDEPVVEVTLTVGCDRRFSRRFVAFADPPLSAGARREPAPMAAAPQPVPEAALPQARALPPRAAARPAPAAASARAPAARAERPSTQPRKPARAASAPAQPTEATGPAVANASRTGSGGRLLLDVGGPRLKLDIEDPIFMPAAPAEGAASATEADAALAAADSQRLQILEKTLADLQREGRNSQEATGALKARLAEAESRSRALPWLAGLLALAFGVAAWLAWRLRQQQQAQETARNEWWAAQPPETGTSAPIDLLPDFPPPRAAVAAPAPQSDFHVQALEDEPQFELGEATSPLPAALALERRSGPAELPATRVEGPHERTQALGPGALLDRAGAEAPIAREVSVEELLDLEQQADFFIALGQEDAAVDLLMSHLRSTGGQSPLPYTKLLEIYRRQDDREAYERIRARFNRRFNAYAPDWDAGPLSGRALEDYAQVMAQLQGLWPEPLDAMALLEAMLFRKDAAHELFDLPAYKDVLLLYSLARDLWLQNGGMRAGGVDVLLPLEDDPTHPGNGGATVEPTQFQLTAYSPAPPAAAGDGQDEVDTRR